MMDTAGLLDLSHYSFSKYAIPFLSAAFLTLFVGGYVFWHSSRRLRAVFSLVCGLIFIWLFSTSFVYSCRYAREALFYTSFAYLGIAFIPPSLCLYVSVWLRQWPMNRVKICLGYVLAVIFFSAILFTHSIVGGISRYFWGFHSRMTLLGVASFLPFFFGYVVLFFQTLYRGYRGTEDVPLKRQVRLVTIAFIFAFFATMDFFPCFGVGIFPTGGLLLFAAFCVLSYTIIRYKLFDIETVVHKTAMWLISTAVVILPFGGLLYTFYDFLVRLPPRKGIALYLGLTLLFYFYFRAIQPALDQLFQRRRANLMALFTRFSGELTHLKNLRELLQNFTRMLRRELYVRRQSVYLYDQEKDEYVPTIAKGIRNLEPFSRQHPFLEWLERRDAVVIRDYVVTDPSVESFRAEVIECFEKTRSVVAVPFVLGGKLIGVAFLGKKANLRPYRVNERYFLAQIKVPMTIAFSNSMRFEDIRALSDQLQLWNQQLEERVDQRTRELVKTQEQLVQAEKLATLGTLAGGVAHEINNPLTAVLTNAQILKMTADKDAKESLDLIEEGAKRCQGIVQKLMKYARKTAEEAPHKPVDLNEVVKGTCALLGFQFQQENIEVEMKLGKVSPVPGIANELEQVLTNLLVNARDAVLAAKGKGKIVIETREAGDHRELIVKDNGIGISKENQKKIFDPFFTTKDVGAGTGLGLAVSYGILKRHNATISVDSTSGKGATFVICFPGKQQVAS